MGGTEGDDAPKAPTPDESPEHPLDAMFKVDEGDITKLQENPTEDTGKDKDLAEDLAKPEETAPAEEGAEAEGGDATEEEAQAKAEVAEKEDSSKKDKD